MIAHGIFAQICDGIVQNVIVCDDYETANWLSRNSYGETAFAVDCLQYPCTIGDKYRDGVFYHVVDEEETPVEYVPTQEQQVADLNKENEELKGQVTDLQLALADQYEENLALQEQITEELTDTQLALAELYEGMEV